MTQPLTPHGREAVPYEAYFADAADLKAASVLTAALWAILGHRSRQHREALRQRAAEAGGVGADYAIHVIGDK